jgi:serine/threonine protein kinase
VKGSIIHREKFERLLEYAKEYPDEIKDINGVRVCFSKEFLIGRGSDDTKIYIGLGKDGYERAVKRLSRDDCASLAEQEMEVLNATESNYVVRYWYFDDKSAKDWLFLIMDLCEESLKEFVKRSRSDDVATSAQTIIEDVLKGLADLHRDSKPILHRDLKPSNILRNVNGRWLLADFGISRIMTDDASTVQTKEKGTKHWRAAESCSTNGIPDDDIVRYKKKSDIQVVFCVMIIKHDKIYILFNNVCFPLFFPNAHELCPTNFAATCANFILSRTNYVVNCASFL